MEKDGLPFISDLEAHTGCGRCEEVCPVDAIKVQPIWPEEFGGSLISEPNPDLIVRRACERAKIKVAREAKVEIPLDVSPLNQGESIRKENLYVEFGRKALGCELVSVKRPEDVEDWKIETVGPDLREMVEGRSYPLGILVEVAGEKIELDFEPVIERHIHEYLNYVRGFMHLGSRNLVWCRVSKESFEKGLRLEHLGKTLVALFKRKMPFIEKIQVKLLTSPEEVERLVEKAKPIYARRDARIKGLTDEEVDEFYGCVLCQSFAPNHVCVITPERISNCGAITWLDAKTSTRMGGGNFVVPKGEVLDAPRGEFSGVNEVVKKMSHGATEKVYVYSMFDYPHTSCGCFEALVFYIPDVDGLGMVHREFPGPAVNKLKFSAMAGEAGGGTQVFGFYGIGIEYARSKKFLRADGGFSRVVWMPKELKKRVRDAIPEELYEKIATERVKDVKKLREFLVEKAHPVVKRWG